MTVPPTELAAHLDREGYVVLRSSIDPGALGEELDRALADGVTAAIDGPLGNRFAYLPMMGARTPVSLALIVELAPLVAALVGAAVLPLRAKATAYEGATPWHADADGSSPVRSVGVACYLDPLGATTGALVVRPGSHRTDGDDGTAGVVLATEPGDAIVFDERLWHSSAGGGGRRRQWRIDYLVDPGTEAADVALRAYLADTFSPGWDGGYDVDRYPSFGPAARALDPAWDRRWRELGAYAAADAEEDAARARRRG